tara:strand:- start:1795 stop:2781 length:987 start_codon:yes stop_codon:yes gene_type:complete
MKKNFKIIFFNFLILFGLFFFIELCLIIFDKNHLKDDDELGWVLKDNLNFEKTEKDFYGNSYSVKFKTEEKGIISYGVKNSNQILVIGDSFSTDPYVSTNKMWYSVLTDKLKNKKNLDVNIKVIGAGGYGTLQQYLLLKRLKSELEPKFIIFQFCTNDFHNNFLGIEKLTGSINQYSRRPYLSGDRIVYSDEFISKLLRIKYVGQSRIINKILFILFQKNNNPTISEDLLESSKIITYNLLSKIKQIYPRKKYFMFNCNLDKVDFSHFENNLNFNILNSVKKDLILAKKKRTKIYYKDGGHYNELGNKIIGEAIFDDLISTNIFSFLE